MLLMYTDGPNKLKFGSSDWHGSWHFDGNKVPHLSFNCTRSGYTLKVSTLLLQDPHTLAFQGYDQWGSRIELKFEKRWRLVDDRKWVEDKAPSVSDTL